MFRSRRWINEPCLFGCQGGLVSVAHLTAKASVMQRTIALAAAATAASLECFRCTSYADSWFPWWRSQEGPGVVGSSPGNTGIPTSGRLLIWGGPRFGRKPKEVEGLPNVATAAVSDRLIAAVSTSGQVYAVMPTLDSSPFAESRLQIRATDTMIENQSASKATNTKKPLIHQVQTNLGRVVDVAVLDDSSVIVALDERGRVSVVRPTFTDKCLKNGEYFEPGNVLGGILRNAKISKVRCGARHCVAIDRDGSVYGWGDNSSKQIGDVDSTSQGSEGYEDVREIVKRSSDRYIVDASCGNDHTVLLSREGHLYSCGSDKWAQQCVTAEPWTGNRALPRGELLRAACVDDLLFQGVACGAYHTVALVRDGIPFSAGQNMHGQLGHHNLSSFAPANPIANMNLRAQEVQAGRNHTCLLSVDGKVFCIGDNAAGQLGAGPLERSAVWRRVKSLRCYDGDVVVNIFAGGDTTAAIVARP